ncbi:MAG: DUF1553 domain-containing protein, partial [Planctomycetes bacterium]|nr:DUF1553 domain-containing protein [Planctomycetota bacterium]
MAAAPIRALLLTLLTSAVTAQQPPRHWAFVVPEKQVPAVRDDGWCRDELDRFVLAGLEARGLRPAPAAERELLLRRAHLVLTGLPPTPGDVTTFLADPAADAYERRVDALLASDACAEHLATPWLDLARFADTYGYQSDFECRTWPWRDWLIRSFADDKPWDRFVQELVAGDLLPDADVQTRTATAFWRLHRQTNEGGSIEAEWRHEYIADRVDTFGTAFLGLTVGCARCHDHKSDPISQRDYYSLGSFFAIDEAGLSPYSTGGIPQPTVRLATAAQQGEIRTLQRAVSAAEQRRDQALAAARAAAKEIAESSSGALAEAWRAAVEKPVAPAPIAHFPFDAIENGKSTDAREPSRQANVPAEVKPASGARGQALALDGDARVAIDGLPAFRREDAFSVQLWCWCPDTKERAVLLHTSHYTEDADTQGYQLLLTDGHLDWQLVHHWPGSAAAIRSKAPFPLGRWCQVVATYDGSARAVGLTLYLDGERVDTEIVRDHLQGPATVRKLELGGRDRDRGFAGGSIDEFALFDRCLDAAEVTLLAGRQPDATAYRDHLARGDETLRTAEAELRAARRALHDLVDAIPELMVMAAHRYPPARHVLRRGAYDQPDLAQPVSADVPAAVLPFAPQWPRDRLGLAEWLNSPRNPLTARVVVDRLWAQCFGRGLVGTPENFGTLGEPPQQQPLLDALAVDFAAQRSVRQLLRRIVCSATFRQSSRATPAQREANPHNTQLARGPSFRLSAEVLRDQALAASGLLHTHVGGPSAKPWQPPGLWRDAGVGWGGADYKPDDGPNARRRSLYTYRKRTAPPPNMTALDAPSREVCVARRQVTDTPLQALTFLNDPVFTECAAALASRVLAELPDGGLDGQLVRVFVALAARAPRDAELAALRTLCATAADRAQALTLAAS